MVVHDKATPSHTIDNIYTIRSIACFLTCLMGGLSYKVQLLQSRVKRLILSLDEN